MSTRRKTRRKGWLPLLLIAIFATALLFGLEYLGQEQVQKRVDQPVALPGKPGQNIK